MTIFRVKKNEAPSTQRVFGAWAERRASDIPDDRLAGPHDFGSGGAKMAEG